MEPPQGHVASCVLSHDVRQHCLHEGPSRSPVAGSKTWFSVAVSNPKLGVDSSFPVDFGVPKFESPPCLLADSFERDVLKENHGVSDFYEQPLGTYDGQAHRDKRFLHLDGHGTCQ